MAIDISFAFFFFAAQCFVLLLEVVGLVLML